MTITRDSYFGTEYPLFVARTRPDAHWSDMTVKQGHADYCAAYGHDANGLIVDGYCMRCGAAAPADDAPSAHDTVRAAAPAAPIAYPAHAAPGAHVALDAPIGTPVRATGAIGTVQGTLDGWTRSMLGMRPIVAYVKHGAAYRSSTFDTVRAAR